MPADDLLHKIERTAFELQEQVQVVKDLEQRLDEAKAAQRKLERETLPDLLAQASLKEMKFSAHGNFPAFEIKIRPFARASIAASWPHEKREEAFDWLDSHGHGDLIKTEVVVNLPKEARSNALELIGKLRAEGFEPSVSEQVHHGTLSKWLKEMIKRGEMVPLDLIGGEVGTEAKMKTSTDEE